MTILITKYRGFEISINPDTGVFYAQGVDYYENPGTSGRQSLKAIKKLCDMVIDELCLKAVSER